MENEVFLFRSWRLVFLYLSCFIVLVLSSVEGIVPGAPNGSVLQNICSSGNFLLAGRCGSNVMSLEGKCCWVSDNSGCLREFDVWNSCYVLCQKPLPHHPPN